VLKVDSIFRSSKKIIQRRPNVSVGRLLEMLLMMVAISCVELHVVLLAIPALFTRSMMTAKLKLRNKK